MGKRIRNPAGLEAVKRAAALALVIACGPPPVRQVKIDPCASTPSLVRDAQAFREAGRNARALRSLDAIAERCVTAESDAMKSELRAALVLKDTDPLALVDLANALAAQGKNAQPLYDRALLALRANGGAVTIESDDLTGSIAEVDSTSGGWKAHQRAARVDVFRAGELRFVIPLKVDGMRFDETDSVLELRTAEETLALSLSTGVYAARPKIEWKNFEQQDLATILGSAGSDLVIGHATADMNISGIDRIVSLTRLDDGGALVITAIIRGPEPINPKAKPKSSDVLVELGAVRVSPTGVLGANQPLVVVRCAQGVGALAGKPVAPCDDVQRPAVAPDFGSFVLPVNATLYVLDTHDGHSIAQIPRGDASSFVLAHKGEKLLAQSRGSDVHTRLFDISGQTATVRWESTAIPLLSAASFTRDGNIQVGNLVIDGRSGMTITPTKPVKNGKVPPLKALPRLNDIDGYDHHVAVGLDDGNVLVFRPTGIETFFAGGAVARVRFAKTFARLAVATRDQHVFVRDVDLKGTLTFDTPAIATDFSFSPNARWLVVASGMSDIGLWTFAPAEARGSYQSPWSGSRTAVAYSPDRRFIVSNEGSETVAFDTATRAVALRIPYDGERGLGYDARGTLVGLGAHGLWTERFLVTLPEEPKTFSVDGTDVFVGYEDGFDIRKSTTGALVKHVADTSHSRGAFANDHLYVMEEDSSGLRIYDRSGKALGHLHMRSNDDVWIDGAPSGLMEVVGRENHLHCAAGIMRLPLAVCDGLRVDPGEGDLFSKLF